jgi:hypothetical protein
MNAQGKNRTSQQYVVEEALSTISLLFKPGDVIEIRALAVGRNPRSAGVTHSGYFNAENRDAIRRAVEQLDGHAEGIYVVLNPCKPELLGRAANRLQARPEHTTSDADITELRWLYIDCDAVRPAGISATDAQHQAALDRVSQIRAFLDSHGWPSPVFCDSGNGGHLLYLLPPLELGRALDLIKRCLKALANRYSDEIVKVDEATANPARLCKLYGTLTQKGDPMPDRPHRPSKILEAPEHILPVPIEAIETLVAQVKAPLPRNVARPQYDASPHFNIDGWLERSGLEVVKGPESYDGGRRWILRTCPFNPEHQKPAILELINGALVYKCFHASCSENDWKALRALIEPNGGGPEGFMQSSGREAAGMPVTLYQESASVITDLSQLPSVWTLDARLEWIVEEMIAQGSITLISAESGTGKTWLGYYLAGCVAQGRPVIGLKSRQSKVLYVDGENPLAVVKQRLDDLGIQETKDLKIWGGWASAPPPNPNNPLVVEFARQFQGLIIYDSLIEFLTGSEQSSNETRAFMRYFRTLANLGAAVVVLHNTGKADSSKLYRGSSDIKAAVDMAYLVEKDSAQPNRLDKLSMTCFKGRLMPGRNFAFEFHKGKGFVACGPGSEKRRLLDVLIDVVRQVPGMNQSAIIRKVHEKGFARQEIERCLENGVFERRSGPHHSLLHFLRDEENDREIQL